MHSISPSHMPLFLCFTVLFLCLYLNIHFLSFNSSYTTDESHFRDKKGSSDYFGHYTTGTWYQKPTYQMVFKENPPHSRSRKGQATPRPPDPTRVSPT